MATAAAAAAAGCEEKVVGQLAALCSWRRRWLGGSAAAAALAGSLGEKVMAVTLPPPPSVPLPEVDVEVEVALVMSTPVGETPEVLAAADMAARSAEATPPVLLRRSEPDRPGMVSEA